MDSPLLTVVVTSYNYARYVSSCIESILAQDFKDFELIVLDNASTDNTAELISEYLGDERVRLVQHEENVGAYLNFNMSLNAGTGRYLAVVSADDRLLPGHFSRMMVMLEANPSCVLAYSPIEIINAEGVSQGVQKHPGYSASPYAGVRNEFADLLALDCYLTLSSVIFDRQAIKDELYFDSRSWGGADWELYVRLAYKYGKFAYDTLPGSSYRIHEKQYSNTNFYATPEALYAHLHIVEKYADDILALGQQQCVRIADYLRRRVAQYRERAEHLKPRLDCLFSRLEGKVPDDARSDVLAVVGAVAELDSEALNMAAFEVIENSTYQERAQVNERLRAASAEWVLLCADGCIPEQQELKQALKALKADEPLAAVCLVEGAAVIESWEDGARAGAVVCRWQAFERAGGYDPSTIAGESVWDLISRLLRERFTLQAQQLRAPVGSMPSLGELARASVIFRNTLGKDKDDIIRSAIVLLDNKESWQSVQEQVLQADPTYGPADFLRLLLKCRRSEFTPLFSVVVTTFNRPFLLECALKSLAEQRFKNFEVVLVNDHGESVETLHSKYDLSLTYLRLGRNSGPAAARNKALRLASGRYVVYLDDDDIFLPDHLQTLADALQKHPGEVVYSDALFVAERIENDVRHSLKEERRYPHDNYSRERLFVDNYIPVNTFAWPRAVVAEVGEFDETLSGLEDWDFLLRLAARLPFHHVQRETVQVRMRVGGATPDRRSQQAFKDYPTLYRELYSRHSDLDDPEVKRQRTAKLKQLGQVPNANSGELVRTWLAARRPNPIQQRLIDQFLQSNQNGPRIGVLILDLQGDADAITQTLDSLQEEQQGYRNLQVRALTVGDFADDSSLLVKIEHNNHIDVLNQAVFSMDSDWCALVRAGERFTASGLLIAALELVAAPDCRAIYADEIQVAANGEPQAVLRPDFNLDLLLSFPSTARHWLFRRDVLVDAGGFDADYAQALEFELVLRLIEQGGLDGLGHVSEPLVISAALQLEDSTDERKAIERHLSARGYVDASVEVVQPGRYRLSYGHAGQPSVSIIVPALAPLAKLQRCVESILENALGVPFELLLLARDGQGDEVRVWLESLATMGEETLRVLTDGAGVTLAFAQNKAAQSARGSHLLFLAADTVVLQANWLEVLLNYAQRPEVGAVGAKLLSSDGSIRHAGYILGLNGPVSSPFAGQSIKSVGYMHRLEVDQNYSAVSGDCLMISTPVFRELGGFDNSVEAANWADVDFCLRAKQQGLLTVWTPHVRLMKEAASVELSTTEQDALYSRWLPLLARDPAYNPNFSLAMPGGFKLADTQISWRPLDIWRPLPVVLAHPADTMGCGHYRVMQPFNALREAGIVDGALSVGLMHVVDLERYNPDAVILQRQIGEERLEAMRRIKAFSRAFKVYELDDYLPNLPMKSVHRQHMPKDIVKSLRRGLSYVDRFVVSTEVMAEAFAAFHPDIRVVRNRLDPRWWSDLPASARQASQKPRVGWAGGSSHTGDLEMIADVIKELASEVEWVFFGMCPEKLKPYVHEFHEGVAIESYAKKLASLNLDLALAPVEQNLFNECKSNLRLLEYGACGFPVICSDVRCYQGDGLPVTRVKNRFRDWVDAIRSHINDLDAAARAGDDLRAAVLGRWLLEGENLEAWRKAWLPG
ncbi:glycosyltransferase [Stutzerimonas nitrititolerans]|uniref:glycosyltransferase n=1 Tax=Stutzerimonas nitrititolerans TaxID=2482751 RepID=UPI00289E597F|nr:glycosyltransferase [Stutzerimonas nitrititolerans]